jgi:hypothetical protein
MNRGIFVSIREDITSITEAGYRGSNLDMGRKRSF